MRTSVAAIALCGLALAPAAPAAAGTLGYGASLGANLADFRGDFAELTDPQMKAGFEGGLHLDYAISRELAFQLGAVYVNKGATYESELTDNVGNSLGTAKSKVQLDYLEVPLLLRATFEPWGVGALHPYLIAGPTLSFTLDGKFDFDSAIGLDDSDLRGDMNDYLWGITAGGGVRFPTSAVGLAAEVRYRTDFGDLWDVSDNYQSINQGVSLTLVVSR